MNQFEDDYKEDILEALRYNGLILKDLDVTLKDDKEVVLEAVRENGLAICYASERLQLDRDLVLLAINKNLLVLHCLDESLQVDKSFILEVVRENGLALQYVKLDLRDDEDIVRAAISNNYEALKYASFRLKEKYDLVFDCDSEYLDAVLMSDDKRLVYNEYMQMKFEEIFGKLSLSEIFYLDKICNGVITKIRMNHRINLNDDEIKILAMREKLKSKIDEIDRNDYGINKQHSNKLINKVNFNIRLIK